jgi:hypothetical protein
MPEAAVRGTNFIHYNKAFYFSPSGLTVWFAIPLWDKRDLRLNCSIQLIVQHYLQTDHRKD